MRWKPIFGIGAILAVSALIAFRMAYAPGERAANVVPFVIQFGFGAMFAYGTLLIGRTIIAMLAMPRGRGSELRLPAGSLGGLALGILLVSASHLVGLVADGTARLS